MSATVAPMRSVYDWQIENLDRVSISSNGWIRGTFFTGVMAAYRTTKDNTYLKAALNWAEENRWQPGPDPRLADSHCPGQTYVELYFIKKEPRMTAPIIDTFDRIMADPKPGRNEWWWCDSLFMAPPVLSALSAATGKKGYLDFMNNMWWDATEFLYDKEEQLYYRDERFRIQKGGLGPRTERGRKIFWSRGNGWVMAGTVRVLDHMPQPYPARNKYIELLRKMAETIAVLQGEDGLWRTNLLDPEEHPAPETSGSSLFCYALAWCINRGILEKDKYLPVVQKAWTGLVGAIDESGRLGWVQLPGDRPESVYQNDTMEYGVGAFLLAGSEVFKLVR